jgi:hypothetical protein
VSLGKKQSADNTKQKSVESAIVTDHDSDSSDASFRNIEALHKSSPSSPSPASGRSREAISKPRRTHPGMLGSIKSKSATHSKQHSSSASPELAAEASRKLSSASPGTVAEPVTQPDSESAQNAARFRGPTYRMPISKMGIIGGRKPQSTNREKTKSPEVSGESTSRSTPPRGKSRMGAIGGKKDKAAGPSAREPDSTASSLRSPSEPPSEQLTTDQNAEQTRSLSPAKTPEPLTEADRANRKRLELKRQLDQGAGRKKKRKF